MPVCGFNLMYPGSEFAGSFFGFGGFGIDPGATGLTSEYNASYTYYTDFIFQAVFAATAATIVSGAVCERIKLSSFLVFSTLFVGVVYPVVGMEMGGRIFRNFKNTFMTLPAQVLSTLWEDGRFGRCSLFRSPFR